MQVKTVLFCLTVACATNCGAGEADLKPRKAISMTHAQDEEPSSDTRNMLAWVLNSGNNTDLPFIILDKKQAMVYVFYADGRLRGATPALIGAAVGDDAVAGIGERKLSAILAHERTTPAGRFVAWLDRNLQGRKILWVDYDSAVSLHPVVTSNAKERRAERLATKTHTDNRISYGCINVPPAFFKNVVLPNFSGANGIVYVLPETRPVMPFFSASAKEVSSGH